MQAQLVYSVLRVNGSVEMSMSPRVASRAVVMTAPAARVYCFGSLYVGIVGLSGLDPDVYAHNMI